MRVLRVSALAGLAAAAIVATASPASAAYIFGPDANVATTEGDINNGVFFRDDYRTQWVFDSSVFGSTPQLINGFSLRFDSVVTNFFSDKGVFHLNSLFSLKLATLTGLASTDFAANVAGADTVLSGAQDIPWTVGGPAGALKPWGVTFNFAHAYAYDPAAGDLLIDLVVPGQPKLGTMDFVGDPYSAIAANTLNYRVFSLDFASPTGNLSPVVPAIRFDVTPQFPNPAAEVPEPSSWALMILGFGSAGVLLRARRRPHGTRSYALR